MHDIARLDSIRGFFESNTPEGVDAGIPGKDMNHDNNVDGKDKSDQYDEVPHRLEAIRLPQ